MSLLSRGIKCIYKPVRWGDVPRDSIWQWCSLFYLSKYPEGPLLAPIQLSQWLPTRDVRTVGDVILLR